MEDLSDDERREALDEHNKEREESIKKAQFEFIENQQLRFLPECEVVRAEINLKGIEGLPSVVVVCPSCHNHELFFPPDELSLDLGYLLSGERKCFGFASSCVKCKTEYKIGFSALLKALAVSRLYD